MSDSPTPAGAFTVLLNQRAATAPYHREAVEIQGDEHPGKAIGFDGDGVLGAIDVGGASVDNTGIINVKDHGAVGSSDDTTAFQAAHDALPATGGTILVPCNATPYVIGAVAITKSNVTIHLDQGATLKRKAGMGITSTTRGMFCLLGLQPANFRLSGQGTIDLNRAAYTDGNSCSAIFALRSTHVLVDHGITVKNSSDSAFTFRNCGFIECRADVDNIFNIGVEFSGTSAETDQYVGAATIPTEEHYVVSGHISNVDDALNGSGNGCGVAFGYNASAIGRTPRDIDINVTCRSNLRDVWAELNGAGSYVHNGAIRVVSHGAKQGCVGFFQGKNLDIDVVAFCPGSAAPRTNGVDLFAVYLAGPDSCSNTIGITVEDDRGSASDYLTCALRVSSSVDFHLKHLNARIVANAAQTVPFKLVNISTTSGRCLIGPVRANITNPPGGTVGISQTAGVMVMSAMPQLYGFATDLSLNGDNYQGFGPNCGLALLDSLVLRTGGQGVRSDTSDGSDSKSIALCGGGGFSDSRGAVITLYGNEATGRLDIRTGYATGATVSFQAVGEEVIRFDAVIPDDTTTLWLRYKKAVGFGFERVLLGADNSAGSGYKVLRVPN